MKYYVILYVATLVIMSALDMLWLTVVAKDFYQSRMAGMLEFHAVPAIVFYILYIAGVVLFVSGQAESWQSVLIYGAFFGMVGYGTYDLTNLATLKGFSTSVALVDMAWGTFNTGFSSALGWWIASKIAK